MSALFCTLPLILLRLYYKKTRAKINVVVVIATCTEEARSHSISRFSCLVPRPDPHLGTGDET